MLHSETQRSSTENFGKSLPRFCPGGCDSCLAVSSLCRGSSGAWTVHGDGASPLYFTTIRDDNRHCRPRRGYRKQRVTMGETQHWKFISRKCKSRCFTAPPAENTADSVDQGVRSGESVQFTFVFPAGPLSWRPPFKLPFGGSLSHPSARS